MTMLLAFITRLLAGKGIPAAVAALPYVARVVPVLTLAIAGIVAVEHGDLTSRICLGVIAANELIVVAQLDGFIDRLFPKS